MYLQGKDEKYYIHNHLSFLVRYHKDEQMDVARIVGFEVKPFRFNAFLTVGISYEFQHPDFVLSISRNWNHIYFSSMCVLVLSMRLMVNGMVTKHACRPVTLMQDKLL